MSHEQIGEFSRRRHVLTRRKTQTPTLTSMSAWGSFQGFKQRPIPKSVMDRKISWNQYEMYLEKHAKQSWLLRGAPMSKSDWLQVKSGINDVDDRWSTLRNQMQTAGIARQLTHFVARERCRIPFHEGDDDVSVGVGDDNSGDDDDDDDASTESSPLQQNAIILSQ
eukprot:2681811-Rhodomonas_salina.1